MPKFFPKLNISPCVCSHFRILFLLFIYPFLVQGQGCKKPGDFPLDETNAPCNKYVKCTRDSLGFISREIRECPQGYVFRSSQCVRGSSCEEVQNEPSIDLPMILSPPLGSSAPRVSDYKTEYINADSSCPGRGAFGIPGDCQRFYWCGAILTTLFKCPQGYEFKGGKCRRSLQGPPFEANRAPGLLGLIQKKFKKTNGGCKSKFFGFPVPFYLKHRLIARDDEEEAVGVHTSENPPNFPEEEGTFHKQDEIHSSNNPRMSSKGSQDGETGELDALPSNYLPLAATPSTSSASPASTSRFPLGEICQISFFVVMFAIRNTLTF